MAAIGIGADADIGNTHLHRQDATCKEIVNDEFIAKLLIAIDQSRPDTRL